MFIKPDRVIEAEIISGIILIPGSAEGRAGYYALDTGTARTVLNLSYLQHLTDNAGSYEISEYIHDERCAKAKSTKEISLFCGGEFIRVYDPAMINMACMETPLRSISIDLCFLGSIGMDLLGRSRMVIDSPARKVIINPTTEYQHLETVPFQLERVPIVTVQIDSKNYRFVLGTAANHFVMDQASAPASLLEINENGMTHLIPVLTFGQSQYYGLKGILTDLSEIRKTLRVDGIIGSQLLHDRVCLFDFKQEALHFLK